MLPSPPSDGNNAHFALEIDGQAYEGLIKTNVIRSYFSFVPTFNVTYTDAWTHESDPWPILPGAACVLRYGDSPVLTGFVNRTNWKIEGESYNLTAEGRGKTQDIADCSATHPTGCWRNKSMRKIVADLCDPLGIQVQLSEPDDKNFKRFEINEGETVFDAISRMARLRGYLLTTHPTGALILVRTANPGRHVVFPVGDAISREISVNDQERFSEYRISSQIAPDDQFGGDASALAFFEETDKGVDRFRPMVYVSEAPGSKAELKAQCAYERNMRAGKSAQAIYVLPGILAPDGKPWAPGMSCAVEDPQLFTDRTLLVGEVAFDEDNDTQTSTITLVKPETFSINTFPKKDKKALI